MKTTRNDSTEETARPKRILGLVASPRASGNCELLTKEIFCHLGEAHDLVLIRLTELNIEPCRGCYACIMDKPCPNKDDMDFLLSEIAAADAVIVTSPVYCFGANGIIKRILDRGFLFFTVLDESYGKPCILANLYGIKDRIGSAPQMLESFAAFLGLDVKASVSMRAALPGEICMKKANLEQARRLAGLMFSAKRLKKSYGCPFCGCEIIRCTKNGFVCTLCHSYFTADPAGGFKKTKDGGVFGTKEHLLRHRAWLQGMKKKFLAKKREIVAIAAEYKDVGQWIKPG